MGSKPDKPAGPKLAKNTVIDIAMQELTKANAKSATVMDGGKVIGSVTMAAMVKAIARPEGKAKGIDTYR